MNRRVLLSVLLTLGALLVFVGVVGGAGGLFRRGEEASRLADELEWLRSEVVVSRQELRRLGEAIEGLRVAQDSLVADLSGRAADEERRQTLLAARVVSSSDPDAAGAVAVPALEVADLQGLVAATLEEERRVRDEERDRQRQEARDRMEERRRELAVLAEGPYGRDNLKVNSLARILQLDASQAQGYHELTTAYREKLEEGMKAIRETARTERASGEGGDESGRDRRRGGFGRGGGEAYRELATTIEKEYEAAVQQLLTPQQGEVYAQLSRGARSLSSRDEVRAPGAEDSGDRGRGGFGAGFGSFGRGGGSGRGGR